MKATCATCGTWWVHTETRGHCGGSDGCHHSFVGTKAFDAHQSIRDGRNVCHHPATMKRYGKYPGLMFEPTVVKGSEGVFWRLRPTPAQAARQEKRVAYFNAVRDGILDPPSAR